ncbi:MAG: hypothetical protein M0R37_13570 [Bacteroidales bacterium]|jgi:hypothetical protein|nr:hypothetical protein [Bacteroidales bacterium]
MLIDGDLSNGATWSEGVNEYVNVRSHAALAVGDVIAVVPSTTGPVTSATVALAGYQTIGVVCQAASDAGEQVIVQTKGYCEAMVEGTTDVTVDDFMEVLATEAAFKLDHATVRSVNSVAVAVDGVTAAGPALASVYLIGERVIVAAS